MVIENVWMESNFWMPFTQKHASLVELVWNHFCSFKVTFSLDLKKSISCRSFNRLQRHGGNNYRTCAIVTCSCLETAHFCLFVCNWGGTYYSITVGFRQGSLAKPLSLLFLTPRLALSSHQHRTLVCLLWSGNLHCAHLPANLTTARQEFFELLDVSNSPNYSFSDT